MDAETRQALDASIEHWRKNTEAKTPDDASTSAKDCALCNRFCSTAKEAVHHRCKGCPVFDTTQQILCDDTPYGAANRALGAWERAVDWGDESAGYASSFRVAAEAEHDFLESLRD